MITEYRFKRIFEPDKVVTVCLQGSLEEFQHEDSPLEEKKDLNEMKFIFYITDDWDEGRKELESMPMTLGDLIDNNPIEFTDGTECDWNDLDWETCEVKVKLLESKQ